MNGPTLGEMIVEKYRAFSQVNCNAAMILHGLVDDSRSKVYEIYCYSGEKYTLFKFNTDNRNDAECFMRVKKEELLSELPSDANIIDYTCVNRYKYTGNDLYGEVYDECLKIEVD